MAAADLDLLLHQGIRLFMREEGMSADQAFDAAVTVILALRAQDSNDAAELAIYQTRFPELRESILPAYREPQPDLSDLSPLIKQRSDAAAKRQRQRQRRRQRRRRP